MGGCKLTYFILSHNHGNSLMRREQFSVSKSSLAAMRSGDYDEDQNPLGYVTILGVEGDVSSVTFGGANLDAENWHFDSTSHVLRVDGLDTLTKEGAWAANWDLSWS